MPVSKFPSIELEGELASITYVDGSAGLALITDEGPEILSTNLGGYGLVPAEGNVFIKDYSEHSGVTDSLVASGVVEVVRKVEFGRFGTSGYEVKVLAQAPALA